MNLCVNPSQSPDRNARAFFCGKKCGRLGIGSKLRYDIIPAVESIYSTYAESASDEDLQASREHRAMAGLSNGCRITYRGGMEENFDYISRYGCFSSYVDADEVLQTLHQDKYAGLKPGLLCASKQPPAAPDRCGLRNSVGICAGNGHFWAKNQFFETLISINSPGGGNLAKRNMNGVQ